MTIVTVIPCFNEANHIKAVVSGALKFGSVVVSDDGSTDATRVEAAGAGAWVIAAGHNAIHGYGAAVRRGLHYATQRDDGDIIIIMDGDGQHDPHDIPALLAPVLSTQADVVVGSRLGAHDKRPLYRRLSNAFGTWVSNIGARQKVDDALTGFWAIRVDCLPKLEEAHWGLNFELLARLRKQGARIASVPVKAIWYADSKANSTVPPVKLGLIMLLKSIKWRLICRA